MGKEVAKAVLGSGLQGRQMFVLAWLSGCSPGVVSGRGQQQSSSGHCAGMVVFCSLVLLGLELSFRFLFPMAAADLLHSDGLCVAVSSVALSSMKNLLLLRARCRFLAC